MFPGSTMKCNEGDSPSSMQTTTIFGLTMIILDVRVQSKTVASKLSKLLLYLMVSICYDKYTFTGNKYQ